MDFCLPEMLKQILQALENETVYFNEFRLHGEEVILKNLNYWFYYYYIDYS